MAHVNIEDLSFDLHDFGERMLHWHAGQGDPIYAVGSFAFSGKVHADRTTIANAHGEIERQFESGRWRGADLDELAFLLDSLNEMLAAWPEPLEA